MPDWSPPGQWSTPPLTRGGPPYVSPSPSLTLSSVSPATPCTLTAPSRGPHSWRLVREVCGCPRWVSGCMISSCRLPRGPRPAPAPTPIPGYLPLMGRACGGGLARQPTTRCYATSLPTCAAGQRWRPRPGGAPTGNITLVSVLDGQPTYLTRAHGYKPSHGGRLPINLGSKNCLPGSHTSAGWPATGGAASSPQK